MPLVDCPACGHRVSQEALSCPSCGHPRPGRIEVPPTGATPPAPKPLARKALNEIDYGRWGIGVVLILFLILGIIPEGSIGTPPDSMSKQALDTAPDAIELQRRADSIRAAMPPGEKYCMLLANVWIGYPVFTRSTHEYVGRITEVDKNVRFPDGTTGEGVAVTFEDGTYQFVKRKILTSNFVTLCGLKP